MLASVIDYRKWTMTSHGFHEACKIAYKFSGDQPWFKNKFPKSKPKKIETHFNAIDDIYWLVV